MMEEEKVAEGNNRGWGGKRPGSGRKKMAPEKKKKRLQVYLTDSELIKVKEFIKMIRDK